MSEMMITIQMSDEIFEEFQAYRRDKDLAISHQCEEFDQLNTKYKNLCEEFDQIKKEYGDFCQEIAIVQNEDFTPAARDLALNSAVVRVENYLAETED